MHRFFFVHVQKTGGTALQMRLKEQFSAREIYPDATDGDPLIGAPQLSIELLLDRWKVRAPEIRVVTGHFPLCTTELLDGAFTTMTLLRDPVERTLSYLRHHRAWEDHGRSLEEIYEDPFRFHGFIHNHMVKMFSLRSDEMTGGMLTLVAFTREDLIRAENQLATVDVVGLQERFGDFCAGLERRFSWQLGRPRFANRTEPEDVPESFRRRIADDNALDVELYEHARELVASRGQ